MSISSVAPTLDGDQSELAVVFRQQLVDWNRDLNNKAVFDFGACNQINAINSVLALPNTSIANFQLIRDICHQENLECVDKIITCLSDVTREHTGRKNWSRSCE